MTTILINPPPKDACCECCGMSVKEIKPFGKAGDPLVGDFDGAKLVKNYRGMDYEAAPGEIVRQISASWECRDCFIIDDNEYWRKVIEKYSKENA